MSHSDRSSIAPAGFEWLSTDASERGDAESDASGTASGPQGYGALPSDGDLVPEGESAAEEARVHALVEERTRRIQELSRALTLAEQRERMRIARILHDDLQQLLVAAKMAGSFGEMEQLGEALDRAIRITRTLAQELSPGLLRSNDLRDLLRWLAERMYEQHELSVEVESANILVPDDAVRVLLYQLVRELLFNVVKHARTKRAHLSAGVVGGHICLVVKDRGMGFDPSTLTGKGGTGLGLPSVRERLELIGGRLVVESAPGEGTSIVIYAPLKSRSA